MLFMFFTPAESFFQKKSRKEKKKHNNKLNIKKFAFKTFFSFLGQKGRAKFPKICFLEKKFSLLHNFF